jgi:rod shape-determining protein MreD
MVKNVIWASIFALIGGLLQSTLFAHLAIFHAVPDLALLILLYSAYINGGMTGQLTGFTSGLLLDFLSASPLGLNALVRTFIGGITGRLRGAFYLDKILLPAMLCAAGTLVKAGIIFIIHLLFTTVPCYHLSSPLLWVELGLNTVIGPFLFLLLRLFNPLLTINTNGRRK